MHEYILALDVWEIVGKLFCWWNGQVTVSKRAYRGHTSPSQSTLVLVFCLISLSFHFTDCPHKRRALSSNSNHFPIMQIISLQKSSTPGAHQFSKASSLNTCIFFSLLYPPFPPSILLKRRVYFWCIALVFTLQGWGNRMSSYPINLHNPLWRVCFFSMVRSEIIQMYGEYTPAVKSKLHSYSHGLFRVTALPFKMHTSHQHI